VRTEVVVGFSEALEESLLDAEVGARRIGGTGFEGTVHAFMGAVLLWVSGSDALVSDAELKPPHVEVSKPVNASRREGSPVVTADRVGKTVFTEQASEVAFDAWCFHIGQSMAAEQVAAEVVDDGERVAVATIAHEELPFEVDGPDLIGSGGVEGGSSGMLPASATSPGMDAAVALKNIENGAACRQGLTGETCLESLQNLSGSPPVPAVLLENQLDEIVRGR